MGWFRRAILTHERTEPILYRYYNISYFSE